MKVRSGPSEFPSRLTGQSAQFDIQRDNQEGCGCSGIRSEQANYFEDAFTSAPTVVG